VSILKAYKPGQAKLSRTIALLSGLFLIVWAGRSLLRTIPSFWPAGGDALNQTWYRAPEAEAWRVNAVVVNEKLSPASLIAAVVVLSLSLWWWRFVNKERWADLLIDMETELRKVSWPTASDAWQSTLVVTGFTFTVVVTILVYDLVIKGFFELFV
jgi:preprotein translocase SecE subunit